MRGPKPEAAGDLPLGDLGRLGAAPRWLWGLRRVIAALSGGLLAVLVASLDAALSALAAGVAAHLPIMLCQGWSARRSKVSRGQLLMHARAFP